MYLTRSVCAYRREEVLRLEAVCDVVEFLAVAGEEDGSGSRSVSNANDVSLDIGRSVGRRLEGLVVAAVSIGHVRYRRLVVAWDMLERETGDEA